MNQKPKQKTDRSKAYCDYIRKQPCIVCYQSPSQHHHEAIDGSGGMGLKCSDFSSLPLCHRCHYERHHIGRKSFYKKYGIDYVKEIEKYQERYKRIKGGI